MLASAALLRWHLLIASIIRLRLYVAPKLTSKSSKNTNLPRCGAFRFEHLVFAKQRPAIL